MGGALRAYDDVAQAELENAFQRGDEKARVRVRGDTYLVCGLQGDHKKQRLETDPTRSRRVVRTVRI